MQAVLEGTLKPDGTLELDERPSLPAGRVRIVLLSLSPSAAPRPGWWEVLQEIWSEQAASAHKPRTKEQIDAATNALRNEWEERLQALQQIHKDARSSHERPGC
jgi:hypothetical protein